MLLMVLHFLLHCLALQHTPTLLQGQQAENWFGVGLGASFMVHLHTQTSMRGGGELNRGDTAHQSKHLCGLADQLQMLGKRKGQG